MSHLTCPKSQSWFFDQNYRLSWPKASTCPGKGCPELKLNNIWKCYQFLLWRHLYAISEDFSFVTWMFWLKMFRNVNHMTLAGWQILLHLHHSLLNCALDFVNFYLFDIPFEFTGKKVIIKLVQLELWNSVMKFGYAIPEVNFELSFMEWVSKFFHAIRFLRNKRHDDLFQYISVSVLTLKCHGLHHEWKFDCLKIT